MPTSAGYTLRYRKHFEEREVWVRGEAFFTVAPREASFIVHTPQLDVRVMGTTFNVNTRHNATSVVLNNGRVSIRFRKPGLEDRALQPGQMLEYANGSITQQAADTLQHTAWKERKFIFTNTPLPEAARQIGDFYGCEVLLKDSALHHHKINAHFDIPADISTLGQVFSTALDVQITKKGHTLEFSEKLK
jgi:transmembrane sensor